MLRNDRERIHESIRRIGQQDSIDRIRILNKSGEIIYSSEAAEIGTMVDKNAEACYRCHSAGAPLEHLESQERTRVFQPLPDSPRLLGIINPIYNAPSCSSAPCHAHAEDQTVLGVLDVTIPLTDVDRNIRRSQMAAVILAVSVIVVLSLIVGLMVRWWIDRPVQELVTATRNVAGGNLAYRLDVKRDDELGVLANSFNNMTDKLAQARLQLFQSDKLASLGRLGRRRGARDQQSADGRAHLQQLPAEALAGQARNPEGPAGHRLRNHPLPRDRQEPAGFRPPDRAEEAQGRRQRDHRPGRQGDRKPALPGAREARHGAGSRAAQRHRRRQPDPAGLHQPDGQRVGRDRGRRGNDKGHQQGHQPESRGRPADQDGRVPQASRTGRPQVRGRRQTRHHHALPEKGANRAHPPRSDVRLATSITSTPCRLSKRGSNCCAPSARHR